MPLFFRAIVESEGGFPRPLLNLSSQNFANVFNEAFGYNLVPPFDPYANSINYLLASYLIPYVGLTGYVGTIPDLYNYTSKSVIISAFFSVPLLLQTIVLFTLNLFTTNLIFFELMSQFWLYIIFESVNSKV